MLFSPVSKLLLATFLLLLLVQLGICQRAITKQYMQQSGYTAASTYFNGFYSNIGSVDEDAFEGLIGMNTIDISFNVIRTLCIITFLDILEN